MASSTTPSPVFESSERWSQVSLFREARLDDSIACARWCLEKGLLTQPKMCWKCRKAPTLGHREDRMILFWQCSKCKRQWQVTAGTVFENSKLPLSKALMLVLCYAQGARLESARLACTLCLGDSKPSLSTVCSWFDLLRQRVASAMAEDTSKIGGPGIQVQIDEAVIGRRKYNRGRRCANQTWVLGMIAEGGEVRLEVVANTLTDAILRNVRLGSHIRTDEWRSYARLRRLGYEHATVNHSVGFVSPEGIHTQRIESQWRALRRKFTRGGIRHGDIPVYLAEYRWRRGCKVRGESLFESLLKLLQV